MTADLSFGRRIVGNGAPASVEGTARALSINLLLIIIAAFPEAVVAAFGIGTRVFSVIFLPAIAFSQGIETMTGQNIGAGEPDRAERANHFGAKVMFVVLTAMGVVAFLAAAPIVAVFTTDPAVVEVGATFVRITALTFGFTGILRAYSGGFRGAGKTLIAAAIAILTLWFVRFPLAWVWADAFGHVGLWYAFAVSNVAGAVVGYLWFRRGTWRESDLTRRYAAPGGSEFPVDD
jgi:Na+-driven multidrug efflux pump